ncbi:MAG: hypothetical protein V4793_04100 [Paraburkholderia tropica]|uniref:hypothetical protein n=1 Tax=Paraburkholderia tropica TaxID=92647 RepID=UPI002AB66FD5|nr:hypothetical protein [Paraburkholderia tropica]
MARPPDNARHALRAHLWHLLELLDKLHEICQANAGRRARVSYLHRPGGQQRDSIEHFLEDFRQELNQAAVQWGIDLEGEQIDAVHALVVTLQFVGIALEEMSPSRLSGFGALDPAFEKDYGAFLRTLRTRLDVAQRQLVSDDTGASSS